MCAFVVLGLFFSIPTQKIGLENVSVMIEWDVKSQLSQSVSQLCEPVMSSMSCSQCTSLVLCFSLLQTVTECFSFDGSMSVDMADVPLYRKLLQFGVLEGLIRRMQKYPVQLVTSEASFSRLPQQQLPQRQLSKYLDGSQCFDEISCHTGQFNSYVYSFLVFCFLWLCS